MLPDYTRHWRLRLPEPALFMNASAAIAETEVRIQCGILSSRHDHAKGARPRKRGGDAPGRGGHGVQAGGLAVRSVNILFQVCLPPSRARLWSLPRPLLQGGSPLVKSPRRGRTPFETPRRDVPRLVAPRACLAWRPRDFATNRHE